MDSPAGNQIAVPQQGRPSADSFYIQLNNAPNPNPINANIQDPQQAGRHAISVVILAFAIAFVCFNLAFIVPDLVYAYQGTQCVKTVPEGFTFDLSVWLQVDAYMRIGIAVLMIFVAIAMYNSMFAGASCGIIVLMIVIMYGLFFFAWTIVGSVMFWGDLNPSGVCYGPVQAYVFALLIITYVSIFCNCCLNCGKKNDFGF